MLHRYVQYLGIDLPGTADLSQYTDGDQVSDWAKDDMAWAVSVGLFQGNGDGTLNPTGDATRAEVAALIQRLVALIVK